MTSLIVDNYPIFTTDIIAGRNLQEGDTGVVILSENNTAFFGAIVGETVTILDQLFEVVGVHGASGVEDATTLYMSLSDVQELTDNVGYITGLAVFVDSANSVTAVSNETGSLHPELSIVTSQQRLDQLNAM